MTYIDEKYLLLLSPTLLLFKKRNNHVYNFRCPFCGDSNKSRTKARGFVFPKGDSLIYKCHNCEKGTNVQNLLKYMDEALYKEYIKEKLVGSSDKQTFEQPKSFRYYFRPKGLTKVSSLRHDHPVKKYVQSRKIPANRQWQIFYAPKFYKWVNTIIPNKFASVEGDHPRLVLPFYDEKGKIFAFQGRAFGDETPKYITIKLNEEKEKIYGLDHVDWNKTVYVVEGPIDSLFLNNCIATAQGDLRVGSQDNVVLVPDNEPRNKQIVENIERYIMEGYRVVIWPKELQEKDVNDMILSGKTEREIKDIIAQNTHEGMLAKVRLAEWRKV